MGLWSAGTRHLPLQFCLKLLVPSGGGALALPCILTRLLAPLILATALQHGLLLLLSAQLAGP